MTLGRCLCALAMGVLFCPLLTPFSELADPTAWSWSTEEVKRLGHLGLNTLALTASTVVLALPLGVCLAVVLFRTSFFARRFFLFVLVFALFVPLPVIVSSWQGTLGGSGWLPLGFWIGVDDRPWATGWVAAIWIHAIAAVPWVVCIVGPGLSWVEPELEDEAAQIVGPWRVLFYVTLPRAWASILAAAMFVMLQTAGEIAVTDMMLISTLAEEALIQFTLGRGSALARTLVIALPVLVLVWLAMLVILARLEKTLPPLMPQFRSPRPLPVGNAWQRLFVALLLVGLVLAPLGSLVWKLGLTGHPPWWSSSVALFHLRAEAVVKGRPLGTTLLTALGTGFLIAGLALGASWLARDSRWFRWLLFSVLTWAWVLPGPVVGIGLHDFIQFVVEKLPPGPWTTLLWDGPSPVPLMWAQTMRILPAAVVFLYPVVRMIPRELFEAARLEGAGFVGEFLCLVWPMTRPAVLITALAASALALGEIAASIHVLTPGWESFTKLLFDRMHYGVDNNVAALAVLMLASLVGGTVVLGGFFRLVR